MQSNNYRARSAIAPILLSLALLSTGCSVQTILRDSETIETVRFERIPIPDALLEPCPKAPLPDEPIAWRELAEITARKDLERISALGYDRLPVCIAKTHLSLSGDPKLVGHPLGFALPVESVRIAAGAGYLLVLTGDIVTMPGLPREPAACRIDLTDDGEITGI